MNINKKIILAALVYFAMCGGMCWYCLGGDIVKDLSGYIQVNPGESRQLQQMKQNYNLNQYLNQQDRQTQEIHNNTINTFNRISQDTHTYRHTTQSTEYNLSNYGRDYGY